MHTLCDRWEEKTTSSCPTNIILQHNQSTQQHSVPDSQGSKAAVETSNKTQQQQQFVQQFLYGQGFSQQLFLKSALQF